MRSPPLDTRPIDDAARDGRFQLVLAAGRFNLVRWCEERGWIFSSGQTLPEPAESYHPREPEIVL